MKPRPHQGPVGKQEEQAAQAERPTDEAIWKAAYGRARFLLNDEHDAKDIAQESFITYLKLLHDSPQQIDSPKALIAKIAAFKALNFRRTKQLPQRSQLQSAEAADPTDVNEMTLVDDLIDDEERQERRKRQQQVLAGLSDTDLEFVQDVMLNGMTPREYAEKNGLKPSAVSMRAKRALERVKEGFEELEDLH